MTGDDQVSSIVIKRRSRLSRRLLLCLVAVGLVGCVVALAVSSQTPPLLSRARFVFDKSQLKLNPGETVEMISDHELLIYSCSGGVDKVIWTIQKLDMVTGKRDSLKQLEHLLYKTNSTINMSPNGRWIKWSVGDGKERASRLDATGHFAWKRGSPGFVGGNWSMDGSAWLTRYTSPAQYTQLSAKQASWYDRTQLILPGNKQIVREGTIDPASPAAHDYIHRGLSVLPGPIIRCVVDDPDLPPVGLTVFDLDPNHGLKILRKYDIPIRPTANRDECLLSPDGQSLVCFSFAIEQPLWRRVLGTFVPSIRKYTERRTSMWASRFDGSNLREVGYIGDTGGPFALPNRLKWFPNNKIGFELDGKYYTIDVGN